MIQEYLLLKNDELMAIKECKPDGVKLRTFTANKGKCRYVQFSVDGDNEEAAKILSKLDNIIRSNFHVTILESGCAAYFNKRLYPLINNFENKLRKLLYLTSAINEKSADNNIIPNLEEQGLGQIFTLLFIDNDFMCKVKENIKTHNKDRFSKTEILSFVESVEENTFWDKLLGKDIVPTLRNHFNKVLSYRNDVMHSHLINWERYRKIQELYNAVNSELDRALHDVEVVESKTPSRPNFNSVLEQALKEQEEWKNRLAEMLKPGFAEMQGISSLVAATPAIAEYQTQVAEICKALTTNSEMLKLQKQIAEINKQYQDSPLVKAIHEIKK